MVERIHALTERFPEYEGAIRELIENDPEFDRLCEEYRDITYALRGVARASGVGAIADPEALKRLRVSVEEELLTRIEGYQPI